MDWFLYENGPRHERVNYSWHFYLSRAECFALIAQYEVVFVVPPVFCSNFIVKFCMT